MNFHYEDEIREDTVNTGIRYYDDIRYGSIMQMKSMARPGVRPWDVHGKKIILVIIGHILSNDKRIVC